MRAATLALCFQSHRREPPRSLEAVICRRQDAAHQLPTHVEAVVQPHACFALSLIQVIVRQTAYP
jgi:hypothetical protein